MKTTMLLSLIFTLATLVSCNSIEQPPQYLVQFTVTENDQVLGSPSILLEPDKTGSVASNGEGGYELSVNVSPTQNSEALITASLKTSSGVIEPIILVELGKSAGASNENMGFTVLVNEIRN